MREDFEAPLIGIILCKEKNRTVVEYALHDALNPIGVATYEIRKTLPLELQGKLPSPDDIARLLQDIQQTPHAVLQRCKFYTYDRPSVDNSAPHQHSMGAEPAEH